MEDNGTHFILSPFFMTTGPGCPPAVLLWAAPLLSWGPVPTPLLDPNHPVHLDQMGRNRHHPSEGGDLFNKTQSSNTKLIKNTEM